MDEISKKHQYLKRCLTRYFTDIPDVTDHPHLNELLEGLSNAFREFKKNYEALIVVLDDDDEFDRYQDEFETFQRNFEINKVTIKDRLKDSVPLAGSTSMVGVKLPPLELPVFNGTPADWPSFVDQFNSAVGGCGQISAAQKLQYLKSSMRGEAANVIRHLPTTDAAYAKAWELLRTRFENCREIINGQLKRLFQHENVAGDPSSLRRLLDYSNECRNVIDMLKQSKEDALFNYIIWEKLDAETKQSWELSLKDGEIPRHGDMIRFLEHRARALMNEGKPQEKASTEASTVKCPACGGNHFAFACDRFRQSSLKERQVFVKSGRLCFNCLRPDHSVSSCTSKGCRKCTKSHHTLLHRDSTKSSSAQSNFSSTNSGDASSTRSRELLATAIVCLKDGEGNRNEVRSLLDLGSTDHHRTNGEYLEHNEEINKLVLVKGESRHHRVVFGRREL